MGSPQPAECANEHLIQFINTKEDLLKEPNNKIFQAMSFKYPEIECSIENQKDISVLIDSGAQISCISQLLLNQLIKNNVVLEEIPVTNTFIKGATGVKSKRIRKQVYLPLTFQSSGQKVILCSHFFVVDGLAIPMLLGINWLCSQNSIINLQNKTLTFDIDQHGGRFTVNFKQIDTENPYQEPPEFVFLCEPSSEENFHFQNSPVDEFDLNDSESETDDMRIVDADDDFYCPKKEDFQKVVDSCELLNEDEKCQLLDLLLEYKEIFSQKPGLLKDFEYKIKTKPHAETYSPQTYPVPYKYREKVRETLKVMQKWGIIERGESGEYLNPLVVVIKSNGDVRLCLDGRKTNEILLPDRERTVAPDELMHEFFRH